MNASIWSRARVNDVWAIQGKNVCHVSTLGSRDERPVLSDGYQQSKKKSWCSWRSAELSVLNKHNGSCQDYCIHLPSAIISCQAGYPRQRLYKEWSDCWSPRQLYLDQQNKHQVETVRVWIKFGISGFCVVMSSSQCAIGVRGRYLAPFPPPEIVENILSNLHDPRLDTDLRSLACCEYRS
jgi:hypothetical protein